MSSCPIAHALFEEYTKATDDYAQATKKLGRLVGRHKDFAEAKQRCDELRVKCRAAHNALEQHGTEHGCRDSATQRTRAAQAIVKRVVAD
jgi:hypothetical protein